MPSPQPLLSPDERKLPQALLEHALVLVGRIHRAAPATAQAAQVELSDWRQGSPQHAAAAAAAQRLWNATAGDALRERLPPPPTAAQQRVRRRRVVGLLGLAGFVAAGGAGGRWYWARPVFETALRTGRAQMLAQELPDGTQLDLGANTQARVVFHRDRRVVTLAGGEVRFQVSHDTTRPFFVDTAWGRVRVVGTVFTVAVRDQRLHLAVAQGRVAVLPPGAAPGPDVDGVPAGATLLGAGDALEIDAQGPRPRTRVEVDEVADWTQGWLVFRNTPLPEAVARWNDYLPQPLHLVDAAGAADSAALRALRVTGSYPLRRPQTFVDSLPTMLPVRVERRADGVLIRAAR